MYGCPGREPDGAINRLRAQLLEYLPALQRAFDCSTSKAALILLSGETEL